MARMSRSSTRSLIRGDETARTARAMLYGVGPDDLRVYAVSAGCILCVAALATVVPARRAATHDPLTLLKGN